MVDTFKLKLWIFKVLYGKSNTILLKSVIQMSYIIVDNKIWINFFFKIKGEYYIDVFYANQLVNGSPFKCNVFDSSKIKVTPNLTGVVDQIVKFEGMFII